MQFSLLKFLFFYCYFLLIYSRNPFKSFSYLVFLNKYHYHSGLVFIFLKTTGPPNVLDMITALFGINKIVRLKELPA